MAKHLRQPEESERPVKRPRNDAINVDRPVEKIDFPRQLQQLLTFRQDATSELRHGIASFKAFLEEILYHSDDGQQKQRLGVLRDFLDSQKPAQPSEDRPYLSQLWQAWSFANQNNSDHLSSAVCAVLALLLRTLSSILDFKDHASLLCRAVLQHDHLRLIKRCLDAPRHKEFLLSPSLRLLNEVLSFDGGAFARELYRRREQSFDIAALRKCLTITKTDVSVDDLWRKPAVRTLAVRYILSHLKYQEEGEKIDILKQRQLCIALFAYFRDDPAELIIDVLRVVESNILKDSSLPRASKAALLTHQNLERVLDVAARSEVSEAVSTEAQRWLEAVCQTSSYGILRPAGWYPPGTTRVSQETVSDPGAIDLGLDSLDFWENEEKFQVRNVVLAGWTKTLRPMSDLRERSLILKCFEAAPELVHAYFRENALQMDPKLTNTWLGYASFMFEIARLPIPINVGNTDSTRTAELPPQISIMLNSIFPRPMTHKVFSKCLNQNVKLISHFAASFLVVALEKVKRLLPLLDQASHGTAAHLWHEAKQRLVSSISGTCPKLRDVMQAYRRLPDDNAHIVQRDMLLRLIQLYHQVLPSIAHGEAIDMSSSLVSALSAFDRKESGVWTQSMLSSMLSIAHSRSGMRWFQTGSGLRMSPATTLLRLRCRSAVDVELDALLTQIFDEAAVLNISSSDGRPTAYDALTASLQSQSADAVWLFLDDCLLRLTKAAVKYLDELESLTSLEPEPSQPSLLIMVIIEQAPFVVKKDAKEKQAIMLWVNTYFAYLKLTSDDGPALSAALDRLGSVKGWKSATGLVAASFGSTSALVTAVPDTALDASATIIPSFPFETVPTEKADHPELFRWSKLDLDLALEDGDASALIQCLSSEYGEVRLQARSQLSNLMSKVLDSDLDEKEQIYLLIGELLETFDGTAEQPLCYIASTFAARALQIQLDPTHFLYPKLNQYLLRGPEWRVNKLPAYWLTHTTLSEPAEDDAYWKEVQWVMEWLVDGLRTKQDLDVLRQSGAFERIMALYISPSAPERLVRVRVLELIHRAVLFDAKTLVTRTGVLSWLTTLKGTLPADLRELAIDKCGVATNEWAGSTIVA